MPLLWSQETLEAQMQNSTSGRENSKSKWTTLQHRQKTTSKLYDI